MADDWKLPEVDDQAGIKGIIRDYKLIAGELPALTPVEIITLLHFIEYVACNCGDEGGGGH